MTIEEATEKYYLYNDYKGEKVMTNANRTKQPVVLSFNEVKGILDLIRAPLTRIALALIYCCRLRLSEVVELRVKDVDRKLKRLFIRGSKGQVDRVVILSEHALKILDELPRTQLPSMWLFPCREGHVSVKALHAAFKVALQNSGNPKKASISSLRHSSDLPVIPPK
jgi:integrase/recombinase XerD